MVNVEKQTHKFLLFIKSPHRKYWVLKQYNQKIIQFFFGIIARRARGFQSWFCLLAMKLNNIQYKLKQLSLKSEQNNFRSLNCYYIKNKFEQMTDNDKVQSKYTFTQENYKQAQNKAF